MAAETAGGFDHPGHQHVLEIGGLTHDDGQRREEARHFGLHHGGDDGVLAAGERPVEGGAGEPGLASDVIDRGLAQPLAGETRQRGVDDADPGRRPVVRSQVMQDLAPPPGHL
jgi:hypothetical protein